MAAKFETSRFVSFLSASEIWSNERSDFMGSLCLQVKTPFRRSKYLSEHATDQFLFSAGHGKVTNGLVCTGLLVISTNCLLQLDINPTHTPCTENLRKPIFRKRRGIEYDGARPFESYLGAQESPFGR